MYWPEIFLGPGNTDPQGVGGGGNGQAKSQLQLGQCSGYAGVIDRVKMTEQCVVICSS